MDKYKQRKQVAEWLNKQGYELELDKDGLWMEDYDFTEHKTKDVIDIVLAWEEKRLNEAKATLPINSISGSAYICQNVNGEEAIVFADNIAGVFDKLEEICPDSSDVKVAGKSTPHYR